MTTTYGRCGTHVTSPRLLCPRSHLAREAPVAKAAAMAARSKLAGTDARVQALRRQMCDA